MGKKSRKKKKSSAAGKKSETIDNTVCAQCGVEVDPFHWDIESFTILECCGGSVCCGCDQSMHKKRSDVSDRIESHYERVNGSSAPLPPELVMMHREAYRPCPSCGKPPAESAQEVTSRLVRLADTGHSSSQYALAVHYKHGELGLQKDTQLAAKWCRKAAEQGHLTACAQLGEHFRFGTGVEKSYVEAKHWYELGGNQAIALNGLGCLYYYGDGVEQNEAMALELFRKSAEQGYPAGIFTYGELLLQRGRIEEALVQFEKCARLEDQVMGDFLYSISNCQLRTAECLGMIDESEDREKEDAGKDPLPLMLFWARRAVKNGNEEALEYLQLLEGRAHTECRNCKKPNPQMKCSKCQGASYCDRSCQKKAWEAGHKTVCKGLPKILSRDECAHCGEPWPKYSCHGCSEVYYCGERCQLSHWKQGHKNVCKVLRES